MSGLGGDIIPSCCVRGLCITGAVLAADSDCDGNVECGCAGVVTVDCMVIGWAVPAVTVMDGWRLLCGCASARGGLRKQNK